MVKQVNGGQGVVRARNIEDQGELEKNDKPVIPELKPLSAQDINKVAGKTRAPEKPRFRFAPSPTGHLHIGGARTALMSYLFAKKLGGEFVLRIEDTDGKRSEKKFTDPILTGLSWIGIKWDGDPVFQSARKAIHKEKIQDLIDAGKAYRDKTGAVYFQMPTEGTLTVHDRVKGTVKINIADSDGNTDFIIQRSDGSPTFLLANVVDDGDMGITHVLRGDDHLTNAARQVLLFKALGYEVPEFYHVPLIHGDATEDPETGEMKPGGKLSKRHGATSVIEYQDKGFDPVVLMNHLARLGMSYGTDKTLSIDEIAKRFDPLSFSSAPSPLGTEQLQRRSMLHIKKMPMNELLAEIKRRLKDTDGLRKQFADPESLARTNLSPDDALQLLKGMDDRAISAVADGARARAKTFADVVEMAAFFRAEPVYAEQDKKLHGAPKMKASMKTLKAALEKIPENAWTIEKLDAALEGFNEANNIKYKAYGKSLRWMLTGLTDGLPLHNTLVLIGREASLDRLTQATA